MSQIMKHKRFKRATVLIKRTQCLGMYPRNKGCLPSYEKLRSNNSCLAKALSKQKEKGQLLFSQNVALLAEVQDLSSACNKRDNTFGKILQNTKEMLKMVVTMTEYMTNTISYCREFVPSSNTSLRKSCNTFLRGEDRRLSTRSPTRGIVKPMISGHTITKPTINLSRINLRHINNPSNLSTIEEVSTPVTPVENSNVNSESPQTDVSARQPRNTANRRMPERLNNSSSRISDGVERRLSKRNSRHSGQLSERHSRSKSNRLSQSYIKRHSTEHIEPMRSPRVKLNVISKLLHNCQTINVRRLSSVQDGAANESLGVNDTINNTSTGTDNIISETQISIDSSEESSDLEKSNTLDKNNDELKENNKKGCNHEEAGEDIQKHNRSSYNNVPNSDDPLEGPSWMFNNYQELSSLTNINQRKKKVRSSNKSSSMHRSTTKTSTSCTPQDNKENKQCSSLSSEDESSVKNEINVDSPYKKKSAGKSRILEKESILNNSQDSDPTMKRDTTNVQGFVTRQRGHSFETMDDDLDDFTLMYRRQPMNNVPFDIHDLKLPVLEDTVVKSIVTKEPEPEITTTLQKITQNCLIPTDSNDVREETLLDNFMVNLPLLSDTAIDCTMPQLDISLDTQPKKQKKLSRMYDTDNSPNITASENKKKQKNKSKSDKDPSTVKVVLQKLNNSHVKLQTPRPAETYSEDSNSLLTKMYRSSSLENSSDSENSAVSVNLSTENSALKRPRRQKAPKNLKEPSLSKKLRRLQ